MLLNIQRWRLGVWATEIMVRAILYPLPSPLYPLKFFILHLNYEYRIEKEYLEADNSAHRIDSYGYSNHSWRYQLHGS